MDGFIPIVQRREGEQRTIIRLYFRKIPANQNTEGTGDVVFKVAKNGYYLYVYLVFSNGGIACYQYDCIDM
jgi:hypothetical protein